MNTCREERLGDDVTPAGSDEPEVGGVTNPGYLSDVGVHDTPEPDIIDSLPVDAIPDRMSRDAQFRYKILKTVFMVFGLCSMVGNPSYCSFNMINYFIYYKKS